jgi:hypothetical protein
LAGVDEHFVAHGLYSLLPHKGFHCARRPVRHETERRWVCGHKWRMA